MNIRLIKQTVKATSHDIFLPLTTEQFARMVKYACKTHHKGIVGRVGKNEFSGKVGESTIVHLEKQRVILIGLGDTQEITFETVRRGFAAMIPIAKKLKIPSFAVSIKIDDIPTDDAVYVGSEGLLLGKYDFDKYKTLKRKDRVVFKDVFFLVPSNADLALCKKQAQEAQIICKATNMTRDLQNDNADVVNSLYLEKKAKALAKTHKIKVKSLNEQQLKKLGANLLCAVAQGSRFPPRMIILEYKGNPRSKEKTAVLGKGITFDTGGLNLKPTKYIETMKCDMSGSAVVLGTMQAVAELKLSVNVVGVMAVAENACGGASYKPGDVFVSLSGKTVEIGNTDAEGRLALADALAYTEKYLKPTRIIDFATLTGAVVVALGDYVAGMMGTDEKTIKQLFKAGQATHERVWELPLYKEYLDEVKSDIADMNNMNYGRMAGSIMAGAFLKQFVEKTPWSHVDIAGTAFLDNGARHYNPKGGTGFGVRLMVELLQQK